MVKLKTILDLRRAKADGTYTILFRITNHKEVKYLPFGVSIFQNQWDDKSSSLTKRHPNAAVLNESLSKRFYELQKSIVSLEDSDGYSFEKLKLVLIPKPIAAPTLRTFKIFSHQVVDDMMQTNRTGNALVYLTAVNRLLKYAENEMLKFEGIDYNFIDGFKNALAREGLKSNSIGNYLRSIRALYNKAIKAKIVERELYPFNDITIKTEKTAKRAIRVDELSKIYNYPKKINSQEWHAANYFFLSFALRGISFTDMAYLKENNIDGGYLTYKRRKTKKIYRIKLHPTALRILDHYKKNGSSYLLPIFPLNIVEDGEQAKKITRQWIKVTNKYLNRISEKCGYSINLTTYVIRHTWGTTAKRLGYSNELIAECMGHEYGNKITNIYLDDFEQDLIDAVNDKVILTVIPCSKEIVHFLSYVLVRQHIVYFAKNELKIDHIIQKNMK